MFNAVLVCFDNNILAVETYKKILKYKCISKFMDRKVL